MRYERGHKAATRGRIVEIASKRFRTEGVDAVGIASLMADAGLTHGGFYSHFATKEDLVKEAVSDALDGTRLELARLAGIDGGGLEAIVRGYLRPLHRDRPGDGCAAAALAPEIGRHAEPTRAAFAGKIESLVDLIAEHLPAGDQAARRRTALSIFSMMMGALQLSRAVADRSLSETILESAMEAALALARASKMPLTPGE